jgi:hypothetical protein
MIDAKQELYLFYKNREYYPARFEDLVGKTIVEISGAEEESEVIAFLCDDGSKYMMYHEQDCCESVVLNDICGDVNRLLNYPLTLAEVDSHHSEVDYDSQTWTFYHLATVKGYVCLRWFGESNGYYSEEVDFVRLV